jgi:hypothetical protein
MHPQRRRKASENYATHNVLRHYIDISSTPQHSKTIETAIGTAPNRTPAQHYLNYGGNGTFTTNSNSNNHTANSKTL